MKIIETIVHEDMDKASFKTYLKERVALHREAVDLLYSHYSDSEVHDKELESWDIDTADAFLLRQIGSLNAQAMRETLIDVLNWNTSVSEIVTNLMYNICGTRPLAFFLDGGKEENRNFQSLVLYRRDCYQ